jgi:hypothetical protein
VRDDEPLESEPGHLGVDAASAAYSAACDIVEQVNVDLIAFSSSIEMSSLKTS